MSLSLSQAIQNCPKSMFGKRATPGKNDGRPPNFPGIFALVAKAMLADAGVKFSESTIDAVAEVINPSTLQRQVAQYRERITGKIAMDGTYMPIPEKKPKVKVAPKGIDPISGEKTPRKVAGLRPGASAAKKGTPKPAKKVAVPVKKTAPKKIVRKAAPVKKAAAPAKPAPKKEGGQTTNNTSTKAGNALAKARAALKAKKEAAAAPSAPVAEVADDDVI